MNRVLEVVGQGPDLVLLHGWGMNRGVWQSLIPRLERHFRLHLFDLPGFGARTAQAQTSLAAMAEQLLQDAPQQAYWLGWSLGGLVAMEIAARYPQRVKALMCVASNPKFVAEPDWPGMRAEVLEQFHAQLQEDFLCTLERFIAIQAMGSRSAKQDIRLFKQAVLTPPWPTMAALNSGLQMLANTDLRPQLATMTVPIYWGLGRLDGLVPRALAARLTAYPSSAVTLFQHSAHAPFISEPEAFAEWLLAITATD